MAIEIVLLRAASIIGFAISLMFYLEAKKWMVPLISIINSKFCRTGVCIEVHLTKYGRFLNIPNYIYGLGYYILIFNASFFVLSEPLLLVILAWFVVLYSIYLAWALVFKLKTVCIFCYTEHIMNLIIAISLTLLL